MSMANVINEMQVYLGETYQALTQKQATIPEKKNLANVPAAIRSISGEGALPALELNLPEEIEHNFDELKTGITLPLSTENINAYAQGKLILLFGFKVNQEGWAVNSGGSVYCEQNWRTQDLVLDMNIWNQEDLGYQVVCMGVQDEYQPLIKNIPIKYILPTRSAELIHVLDTEGTAIKNRISLEDINIYNTTTGEEVNKKYFREEIDYWTDTFYVTLEPGTEYQIQITLFDKTYTETFTSPDRTGDWSNISLTFLPTMWNFEGHATTFNNEGYQISLLANSAEITQYQEDVIVKQEIVYPGTNENNPDLICAAMLPDISKYSVKLQAPYFTPIEMEFNHSSLGNTYALSPSFDTTQKRCITIFAGPSDGNYFDRLSLDETNTVVTFLDEEKNGEYIFENGFLVILADIDLPMEIGIGIEGYEAVIIRRAFAQADPPYHSWRMGLVALPENE